MSFFCNFASLPHTDPLSSRIPYSWWAVLSELQSSDDGLWPYVPGFKVRMMSYGRVFWASAHGFLLSGFYIPGFCTPGLITRATQSGFDYSIKALRIWLHGQGTDRVFRDFKVRAWSSAKRTGVCLFGTAVRPVTLEYRRRKVHGCVPFWHSRATCSNSSCPLIS